MPTKSLACTECHKIIDVQEGNPGWWLISNNDLRAKNKKALAILAFTTANGRAPTDEERKAWERKTRRMSRRSRCLKQDVHSAQVPHSVLIGRD